MAKRPGFTKESAYISDQLKKLIESPETDASFKLKCINQLVKLEAKRRRGPNKKLTPRPPKTPQYSDSLMQLVEKTGTQ